MLRLYHGEVFYKHRPKGYHPENPERLRLAYDSLKRYGLLDMLEVVEPPLAGEEDVLRIHSPWYVDRVRDLSMAGGGVLDPDTYVSEDTWEAALAYVGSAIDGASRDGVSIVLGRPPGHHAGRDGVAMEAPTLGFCIFNGSAAAALRLADEGFRALVLDFDVHHGNGTQEILYREARVYHVDLHQDPSTLYPGTGWPWQTGDGSARGTKLNLVAPPGCGDDCYDYMLDKVIDILDRLGFKPNAIVFDAGFDAYVDDGLASMRATSNTYYNIAVRVVSEYKPSRVVVVLEGGYSAGLERGLPAFIAGLLGLDNPVEDKPTISHPDRLRMLEANIAELERQLGLRG